MVKLFTPPYRGVLLLILSFIAVGLFSVILGLQHGFSSSINAFLGASLALTLFIIIFALTPRIFKEPICDLRFGLYFFIITIAILGSSYVNTTWGWNSIPGSFVTIFWVISFYYMLAITPFSNKNVHPVKFIYSIHNKIPHTIPPPLPPDYESPQVKFNKLIHKIFPFYNKPNSPNPESSRVKPVLPQISRTIITIDDIDIMEGTEFERFLKKLFENMGYFVELTNHSIDMGADLILSKSGERISVQAKRWTSNVGNDAIQAVVGSLRVYKTQRGMVVTNSDFTSAAIVQAYHNNVELWNRDKLIEMINKYPVIK
jgi:hypothetical protein